MRYGLIVAAILALFGLYSGYWLWLADRAETEAAALQAREQAAGRSLDWQDLTVTGYPYHIRAELAAPVWQDKSANLTWQTPSLYIHGSPTDPTRVIIDATQSHEITFRDQAWQLNSASLFASVSNFRAALPNVSIEGEGMNIAGSGIETPALSVTKAAAHFRLSPETENAIDLATDLTNMKSGVRFGPSLGNEIESLNFVGTIAAMPPVRVQQWVSAADLALADWATENGTITISKLLVKLPGGVVISAQGRLHAGREGYLAGTLNAKITGYDVLLAQAVQAGALTLGKAQVTRLGLDLADGMDGAKDGTVALPLTLSQGAAYLGPVKMADLPKLFPAKPITPATP